MRAAGLSGMTSLSITDLFPEMRKGFVQKQGVAEIRKSAEAALAGVEMGMILPEHRVNILCSEHGFYLLEGDHYLQMLLAIRDAVEERTGCQNIRLRVAAGMGSRESEEIIEYFRIREKFNGRVTGMSAFDRGVPIDTQIGTLYGLAAAYDADWIIHAGHEEPRDLYFYRMIDRALKAFAMSYARFETRSVYHGNFGNRSCAFIQRAIFDAPFVQEKFAFGVFMRMSPAGITGVSADNDLDRLGEHLTIDILRDFGKMLHLLADIDECIVILDGGRYGYYIHAGGIVFGALENAQYDAFDLSRPAAFGYYDMLSKMRNGTDAQMDHVMNVNPAIKAVIFNQAWPGIPMAGLTLDVSTIVVGDQQAAAMKLDAANPALIDLAETVPTLKQALELAIQETGTDKVLVFDGSFGHITVSPLLAQTLMAKAPEISRRVETELLPLWLSQRGIDLNTAKRV